MAKKRMTVDQLSIQMGNEFRTLRKEVADGFHSLHERADAHMESIGEVKETVTRIEETLVDHTNRLGSIEGKLNHTIERVDHHSVRKARLDKAKS